MLRPRLWFALLFLPVACEPDSAPPKGTTTPTATTGNDDSAPVGELGETAPENIVVELSDEVRTVARVSWTTRAATSGYVRFGENGSLNLATNTTTPGTEHSVLLLGVPPATLVELEVVTVGDPEVVSARQSYTTGALPPELPVTSTTGAVESWVGGYQVLPLQGSSFAVTIVDDQGRFVWYDMLEPGFNLMRALLSADGTRMLYCLAGPQDNLSVGVIRQVDLYTGAHVDVPFPYIDHDFIELPDGTWAGIVVSETAGNVFDRILEMPAGGGDTVEVWNAYEDPVLLEFLDTAPMGTNFTHANALDYDPVEDAYYVSLKNLGTIVKIDRATGNSVWHLNGLPNSFEALAGTPQVELAHQFQMLPGKVLIFDNGPTTRGWSQVLEMALDEDAMTVELLWSYRHDPDLYVFAKGDVERFADGGTQAVWSSAGEIQNLNAAGDLVWQFNTSIGFAITFVQRVESLYGQP